MKLALALLLILSACSPEKEPAAAVGQDERLIEQKDNADPKVPLVSYRKFVFARALRGINSHEHFALQLRFLRPDAKAVLHNHFMGFQRRDGAELLLERDKEDLLVKLSTPGRIAVLLKKMEHLFAHGPTVHLRAEFHDGVSEGTRVLVWVDDLNTEDSRRHALENINAATADIDSRALGYYSKESGRGIFAGLETWSVDVQSVKRDLPYVAD